MTDDEIMHVVRYSTVGSNAIAATEWCAFARALLARQPAAIDKNAVPEGWKLVPVDPTPKMIDEAKRYTWVAEEDATEAGIWRHMLAASPAAPSVAQERDDTEPSDEYRKAAHRAIGYVMAMNGPMSLVKTLSSMASGDTSVSVKQDERGACVRADEPKACYRVRCQLGNKCVDDDMSPRPAAPSVEQDERGALRDMLDDARAEIAMIREALGVPYEPHQTLLERTLDAARAASTSANVAQGAGDPPVFWWNGIRSYDERDGTARSISETENTWHDIPLYAGVNPCNLTAPPAQTAIADDARDAIRRETLATAAKVCDGIATDRWNLYKGRKPYTGAEPGRADPSVQGESDGADSCAAAIRTLTAAQSASGDTK